MQTEPAEMRMHRDRVRPGQSGPGRAEPQGAQDRSKRARLRETLAILQPATRTAPDEEAAGEPGGRSRGAESEERVRRRLHQLERDKLELTSSHNQELCRLQAELTRLRSSVERGEAQRVELQYQLTVSQRDAARASLLSRDKHTLTERAAELQVKVQELHKALMITQQARKEDQHALQQEVEERDGLIQSFSSENQRLHQLLQDQEEALQEADRRLQEVLKEKEKEAEVNKQQDNQLRYLTEREERSRREKELSDQKVRSLESSVEAERAAHLESKVNCEVIQLRMRDVEAALAVERSGHQEAQWSLELRERERSVHTERALDSLQKEYERCRSDFDVAMETERKAAAELAGCLEEEKKQHADTRTRLEQACQRRSHAEEALVNLVRSIRETVKQQDSSGSSPAAKDDGNLSPSAEVLQLLKTTLSSCRRRQETTEEQVQDLLQASVKLQQEKQTVEQLTCDQRRQLEELQHTSSKLEQEVSRLLQESSDWAMQSRGLKAELEKEREAREREREERTTEVQKIRAHFQQESETRLSFLYRLYQRLLAGCVLLDQPQSILGNFTWEELCDVISEQVDQLTSDLRRADHKIAHLHGVCKKKNECVRELQRTQESVLSRLEDSVRTREEAWSRRHTHTVTQLQNELQLCRSQSDSLRDHASSLELRLTSLTSDLARCREESASFLSACALLAGTLKHTHLRLHALCTQKRLLSRRLAEREELEEEVRWLAGALGGDETAEEEKRRRRRRAVGRWRRSVCVVLAVRRWCELANQTTVLFRVERGGGASVFMCGETTKATRESQDDGDDGVRARWLHSKRLSSVILSSMADLQGALTHTDLMSAARSALSRLLDHLLDQSDLSLHPGGLDGDALEIGPDKRTPPPTNAKGLVSTLQQHFLLFSQRLHSAEVERRSLRLEVVNLKRGLKQDREGACEMVAAEHFHSVCVELRQALSREQEAQTLLQEHTHTLQLRVNTHTSEHSDTHTHTHTSEHSDTHTHTHTSEHSDTHQTLKNTTQSLKHTQQELSRKERSLRILGKHLSGVQREKKKLEERLRDVSRCKDCIKRNMKTAETNQAAEVTQTAHLETTQPVSLPDSPKRPLVHLSTAPSLSIPPPSSPPLSQPARSRRQEKRAEKNNRGGPT